MKHGNEPKGARRSLHPREERDDGTPLRELVLGAVEREVVRDERELIEALFLGYLEPEDETRARALLESSPEARAYWAELTSDDDDEAIRAADEELVARMPWLRNPGVGVSMGPAPDLASLRLPGLRKPAESGPWAGDTMTEGRAFGSTSESLGTIRPADHHEASAEDPGTSDARELEIFDRQWAQQIMDVSFLALEKGPPSTREWLPILRPWILADPGDASLKEIATIKNCTHDFVRAQLHRLRKAWRQAVRDSVALTVAHPDEIDNQLRHLAAVLARHPVE